MPDILEQLGYLAGASRFRRISEKLHIDGDKIYKDAGIDFKASWFSVYYVLAKSNEPKTVMEITSQIAFSHITVKNIVRELDKKGLIEIAANSNDKRSKLISLSDRGILLLNTLQPLWLSFSGALEKVMTSGHPDITNILKRIDTAINLTPIHKIVSDPKSPSITVIDYKPGLKEYFYKLAGPWLLGVLNGQLEEEDEFTLKNPDLAYLSNGGFVFYAKYGNEIVGCVALKRLDDHTFEFAKLYIDPNYRKSGIATKLIERCITRCVENEATQLWLQTTLSMPQAHKLYYKLGFLDKKAPAQMAVLKRTEKIMCLDF
ncbi:bifunctional helix-turn-helix transcriptional regulator/GNAT family N-acetyltransferase [Sinomicrobium weinanense]|uniref:Bifunctional helix-turn-helix transcriptional regulator/GNAT family N-acetyltransferase n=1 Tax=Sinomicrobium weinanense TaxID=2842200 RepID=A0A926JTQ3_9FLAO|nr:bifunctional helix-turn-helix transcriptional regulator/GNAT family N-acetyltransferase [Sinomicrobium weinanense]MBC9797016.1 bifunctional helix-turn-helix transcriptional regulator/GNAT family N-acetyltransferase [Sinomicrobium weinanense]MBU3123286.1 bifunctional helix-turn-helix transcriptional regulator/GNAT family N-acetyltransferase [Sinomicrobium weinanense]